MNERNEEKNGEILIWNVPIGQIINWKKYISFFALPWKMNFYIYWKIKSPEYLNITKIRSIIFPPLLLRLVPVLLQFLYLKKRKSHLSHITFSLKRKWEKVKTIQLNIKKGKESIKNKNERTTKGVTYR